MLLERDQMCQKDTDKEWRREAEGAQGALGSCKLQNTRPTAGQMPGMGGEDSKGQGSSEQS